jgi:murein DD-endopeptidase MepM/ murein hydrolase activator NlpD
MKLNRLLILILFTASLFLTGAGNLPPAPVPVDMKQTLSDALASRLQTQPATQALTPSLFTPELDTAFTTPDGKTAVLWLALRDEGGHILATEPGLALARLLDDGWHVLLPGDPAWDETLASLPEGMLPQELSPAPRNAPMEAPAAASALTGYYLPYAAGTARWLEGSISHFQSIPELGYPSCLIEYCHYAYDFTYADHYPLLASKDGTVFAAQDGCTDGSETCTNYIVLYNAGDQAYQIYLHLSHNTIPDKLTSGVQVKRGQYLGDTDDTGYSTSNHVHFMVVKSIWFGASGYYWGYSVDVRFADVAINGGMPRTCYEVTHFEIYDGATACLGNRSDPRNPANDWFVSGNVGAYPPTGTLTRPAAGVTVNSGSNPLIDVTANVSDDVGVTAVRLVAKLNGQWVEIGPRVTQPALPGVFDWDADLCAVGPLNGPLDVALRAWDHEGNVSAALNPHTINVDHACPPPASQLAPAETFNSTAVHLSWTASAAGAGLGSFELQWRSDPGTWDAANTLTFPASQQSAWFSGQPGVTYDFRLRALDTNGQPEPWPAADAAETSTSLPAACAPDVFEPDDTADQARSLTLGLQTTGSLCGTTSNPNPDWSSVGMEAGKIYLIQARSQSGGAAVKITVYGSDGTTVLASTEAGGLGQDAAMTFRAGAAGIYYIKIEPLKPNLSGSDALYRLAVSELKFTFMPKLTK